MEKYQERVIEEYQELSVKIDKLAVFLTVSDERFNLSSEDLGLLNAQYHIMKAYMTILQDRINR